MTDLAFISAISRTNDLRIDQLEAAIIDNLPAIDCPVKHLFAKGMYIREIFIPAGVLATSKIHKTQHPFTISKGKVLISDGDGTWVKREAPFTGITKAGSRRVVAVIDDCTWTTYHAYRSITGQENEFSLPDQLKIVDRIESRIIIKHTNKVLNNIKKQNYGLGSSSRDRHISRGKGV
jgi:hypothetical protein